MREARRNRRRKSERAGNRMALLGITFVVFSLAVAINIRGSSLETKNHEYQVRQEILSRQLEAEKDRAEKLKEKKVYVQTKKYIEQVAKEKLGLVNPDEILLKPAE